ncbi:MAG: hypothetical protein HKN03_14675 [Acidimicrobiales bacterium]|nr:hypothetical protein [Acidimicrobiales bacterium]
MPHVLFICPHGAAKSVIAAHRFRVAAGEAGLTATSDFAGFDPDPAIAPAVASTLAALGHDVVGSPRLVSAGDIESADVVVTLGFNATELPTIPKRLVEWPQIPSPSAGVEAAITAVDESMPSLLNALLTED